MRHRTPYALRSKCNRISCFSLILPFELCEPHAHARVKWILLFCPNVAVHFRRSVTKSVHLTFATTIQKFGSGVVNGRFAELWMGESSNFHRKTKRKIQPNWCSNNFPFSFYKNENKWIVQLLITIAVKTLLNKAVARFYSYLCFVPWRSVRFNGEKYRRTEKQKTILDSIQIDLEESVGWIESPSEM